MSAFLLKQNNAADRSLQFILEKGSAAKEREILFNFTKV